MKKEFICVQPRSTTAKQDFVEYMNELHSCVVTKRKHGMLSLSSISGKCPTRPEFDTWNVPSVTYKGAHFAVYPPELIEKPILSCCPEQGIVIDPFMGSGTTGEVAKLNNRRYIGLELNPEYAILANERISKVGGIFT